MKEREKESIRKTGEVVLRQEVYRDDARKIAQWLESREVTQFLNEYQNVSEGILEVLERVPVPVVTHLFNQDGSFFMVDAEKQEPVGYLKLVPRWSETEMIIVIGDRHKWGRGFGAAAVFQGLRHAFFEWRADKVVAIIHTANRRSIRVFQNAGFRKEKELTGEIQFCITMSDFLKIA